MTPSATAWTPCIDVGEKGCTDILAARPYTSLEDYLARARRGAEKTTAYNLILIGAFDSLGPRPETLRRLQRYRATDKLAESTLTNPERLEKIVGQRLASGKYEIPVPDFTDPAVVYAHREAPGRHLRHGGPAGPLRGDPGRRGHPRSAGHGLHPLRQPVHRGRAAHRHPAHRHQEGPPPRSGDGAHHHRRWNEADFRVVCFPEAWACRARPCSTIGVRRVACQVKKLDSGCCLETVERLDVLFDREGIA